MKLAEGEGILDVQVCTEKDDVLLTTAQGQCIRFPVTDVRVFQGRTSMGVRGINLAEGDRVISQSILRHLDVSAEERMAYLKRANAVRRGDGEDRRRRAADAEEAAAPSTIELGEQRYVEMSAAEQFILTISERGYGKRSSSYEYRITNRGGKGIVAMAIWEGKKGAETIKDKIGQLVASFPVEEADQIMLVTDGGQADPLPGERHPHRRPLDPGRDRVQHRRGREGGVGRAHRRRGRRQRRELAAYCSRPSSCGARRAASKRCRPVASRGTSPLEVARSRLVTATIGRVRRRQLLHLDAGGLDHVAPERELVCDHLAEVSGVPIVISAPRLSSRCRVSGSFERSRGTRR